MPNNSEIINKAANDPINTGALTSGLLSAEQSKKFLQQTFEATNLGPLVRHEMRVARSGEIDKIGIGSRLLRAKTENNDDGYRAGVNTSAVKYDTVAVRLPWEITEEALRENIEGQNFENIVTNLMATQVGIDNEDLCLNGDKATESTASDYAFLSLNNGWIKKIKAGGHLTDAASAEMSLDMFYKALQTLPNKYNNGKLRWLMSPKRAQAWTLFLMNKVITNGGAVPDNVYQSPAAIPAVQCPSMSDNTILLTDPQNLCEVNTYTMQIRKTTEGKEAIMMDKRFYVIHYDIDSIIEEVDATGIITNLKAL